MKKIITMVGTSLFENYLEEENAFKNYIEGLRKKRAIEYERHQDKCKRVKESIVKWIDGKREEDKVNSSAELKSLMKIHSELKESFEAYFLYSDTILSKIAGEILSGIFKNFPQFSDFQAKTIYIEGLQIWNREEFNKGMSNLINEIYEIAGDYWGNIIINITGGYKATIPFLTILAQLNGCPLYYIFEDTDALIKIPNMPFSTEIINWEKLSRYEKDLIKLEKGIFETDEYMKLLSSDFYKRYNFLIWEEGTLAELNPIGKIFLEKYKNEFFSFYCPQEVLVIIENSKQFKRIFSEKFHKKEIRNKKTEMKNGHYVYDDGDNPIRIFYREREGEIYIYKVFERHGDYENYLKTVPYSDELLRFKPIIKKFKKENK